ncbi:MAG: hypothetical protein JO306_05350 [Gemmatimonadetes bacterium]|nr:hypothetical protein [Gemmatimonadota bacterium]
MSNLVEYLYPLPDFRRTPLSALRWWESRRLVFNAAVGAAGLVTASVVTLFALLPPHPATLSFTGLAAMTLAYAIAANVCYTLGWPLELLVRRVLGRKEPELGPLLFRQGVFFAVGLTLLPTLLAVGSWIVRILITVTS